MREILKKTDFEKGGGLLPVIIQDAFSFQVLMLGYMNKEALNETLKRKKVVFWSRSKKRLWLKGETSGNYLKLIDMSLDCDDDALLIKVEPLGPVCHTGQKSCFKFGGGDFSLSDLYKLIEERRQTPKKSSYTSFLLKEGFSEIGRKVIEEADEVVYAAKNETKKRLIEEAVDVLYHLFVLLVRAKISFVELMREVKKRRGGFANRKT